MIPLRSRGARAWTTHYVCVEGKIAYDPAGLRPFLLRRYTQSVFGEELPIETFVAQADVARYLESRRFAVVSSPDAANIALLARIIEFIRWLGIEVADGEMHRATLVPGIDIRRGRLVVGPKRMCKPADLLHEAAHVALRPTVERAALDGTLDGSAPAITSANATTAKDAGDCTGSKSQSVTVAPVAMGDSYSGLVDNTQFVITGGSTGSPMRPFVGATGKIITKDLPSGFVTATAGTFATSAGGSVTIAADGTFIYTPKANPTAAAITSDSFTYTVFSNTGGGAAVTSAPGTVSLTLAERVWYVKNDGAAGNGATTNLTSASALKTGQRFIGEGVALVVNGNTLVAAGSVPLIGNTVTLASSVTVNGIDMTTAASNALVGTSISVSSVTVRNITTTSGKGINWSGVTSGSTVTFNNVNSTSGGAVDITSSGATDFTFNDVTSTTGTAVKITTATGDFTFHAINVNGGTTGISVNTWAAASFRARRAARSSTPSRNRRCLPTTIR